MGVATWIVTCDSWGLQTFSVNGEKVQVDVTGFRQTTDLNNVTLYYDNEKVMAVINYHPSGSYSQDASWRDFTAISNVPEGLRPSSSVYSETASQNLRLRLANTGVFQYQTPNGSVSAPYIQCIMTWYLI